MLGFNQEPFGRPDYQGRGIIKTFRINLVNLAYFPGLLDWGKPIWGKGFGQGIIWGTQKRGLIWPKTLKGTWGNQVSTQIGIVRLKRPGPKDWPKRGGEKGV